MSLQFDSTDYWRRRYKRNWDSGAGSYGQLAKYKANFLNNFVRINKVSSVIELGCGDGAQLDLAEYPQYVGVDISPVALDMCRSSFFDDMTKCFISYNLLKSMPRQDLSLSLDVIFHLVEDGVFERYMADLFASSNKFVIVYSSNRDEICSAPHVRHRNFTPWIEHNLTEWSLIGYEPNVYPENPESPDQTSFADFFIYKKR
ncbi:hypothetical protein GFC08_02210 [Roseibium aggregatum]|nr:hypothetical protein GFC08_02210 [Roseibium aggregatum]